MALSVEAATQGEAQGWDLGGPFACRKLFTPGQEVLCPGGTCWQPSACEREQQHAAILVRNEGLFFQLKRDTMC